MCHDCSGFWPPLNAPIQSLYPPPPFFDVVLASVSQIPFQVLTELGPRGVRPLMCPGGDALEIVSSGFNLVNHLDHFTEAHVGDVIVAVTCEFVDVEEGHCLNSAGIIVLGFYHTGFPGQKW